MLAQYARAKGFKIANYTKTQYLESVISKNAYLEKKWGNCYYHFFDVSSSELYKEKRLEWMEYRKKLRSL